MAIEIFMPALSPTMEEGTLAKWLVKEGDSVESGDVIAEIETDKATMEVESIDEGTIAKILVAEGSEAVPVGQLIAIMAEEGESAEDAAASAGSGSASSATNETVEKVSDAPAAAVETAPAAPVAPTVAPAAVPETPAVSASSGSRVKASPLAKRIAKNEGLDITTVTGTGPNGRIVKRDVEAALAAPKPASAAATPAQPAKAAAPAAVAATDYPPLADNPYEDKKLSGMRKVIAKRLTESKTTVPHFYLTVECELDKLLAMRKEVNNEAPEGVKVSVNDFIIKAVALALKEVPAANVQFAGDKMYWYERADISVAVAVDGGLVTPVVKGACSKGLGTIAGEVKDMAGRARDGKLMPEEMQGGTFSISNLGMFGIKEFSAVINPPQGAILAVGAGEQRAIVKDGAVAVATVMNCTLSCDHRAIDGAVGAEFLSAFKRYIQNPITMML